MVETGNVHAHRKFIGNAALHRQIAHYAPPRFLRRNLRRILEAHERSLPRAHPSSAVHTGANAVSLHKASIVANARRSSDWFFPTREMAVELIRGEQPALQLDALQIRHPKSLASINHGTRLDHTRVDGTTQDSHNPEWLRDPTHAPFEVPGRVSINIFDTRGSRKLIFVDHRAATIIENREGDETSVFDIVLYEPFQVDLYKFSVVTDASPNGGRSWKKAVTNRYGVEIIVQCQDSDDSAELLCRVEGHNLEHYRNIAASETMLKATWESLPSCPPQGQLLPVRRAKGHKVLELEYQMELSMNWKEKQDSVLERYNQSISQGSDQLHSLPTPFSDDLEKVAKKAAVLYKYRDGLDTRTFVLEGLDCPFCPNGIQHSSFDRLHLHILTHHDHFKVEVDDSIEDLDASTIRRTIVLSSGDSFLERQAKFEDGWLWIAPDEPFDLRKELRGDRRYLPPTRAMKGDGRRKNNNHKKNNEKDQAVAGSIPPSRKRPPPDQVQDLPSPPVKKHMVPNLPGVRFYHSTSKQHLVGGMLVADDDERTDGAWLPQRLDVALERLGVTGVAKDFHQTFDRHFSREQSGSHILTNEGLVRFVRVHLVRLQSDHEWQEQFWQKIDLLRDSRVLDPETIQFCHLKVGRSDGSGEPNPLPSQPNGNHLPLDRPNGTDDHSLSASTEEDGIGSKDSSVAPTAPHGSNLTTVQKPSTRTTAARSRWDPAAFGFVAVDSTSSGSAVLPNGNSAILTGSPSPPRCSCGNAAVGPRGSIGCDNAD